MTRKATYSFERLQTDAALNQFAQLNIQLRYMVDSGTRLSPMDRRNLGDLVASLHQHLETLTARPNRTDLHAIK